MKSKIRKLIVIALATTMLMGTTLIVHAKSFTCSQMGCNSTLIKHNYVGTCGYKDCISPTYRYTCPNNAYSDPVYHTQVSICDSGHRTY